MERMLDRPDSAGLEGLCTSHDWVHSSGPVDGVETLQAWFGGRGFGTHRHGTYAIGITDAGVQEFEYRGQVERSGPGQVVVLHPDEPHDGRAGTEAGFGYRIVYIDPSRIADAVRTLTDRPAALPFARSPVGGNRTLFAAVEAAFQVPQDDFALDSVVVRFAEGLLELDPSAARSAQGGRVNLEALERARDYLDAHATLARSRDLEAVTGLTRYEVARQFRVCYGMSPYRYALVRRLESAIQSVQHGLPLVDAALGAGFADQAHFTRMFRAARGMPPGRYAKLRRGAP